MLGLLRKAFSNSNQPKVCEAQFAPSEIKLANLPALPVPQLLDMQGKYPVLHVANLAAWLQQHIPAEQHIEFWQQAERAWLLHLRDALGSEFHLAEAGNALLLSSVAQNTARTTVEFIGRTQNRILKLWEGVAQAAQNGRDILIVFDDSESYYQYVASFYPAAGGTFSLSSGMYLNTRYGDYGNGHFVTLKNSLYAIEPVIVHELTHSCLAHLPLPLWLNEGIAVNTERKLVANRKTCGGCSPQQLHHRLLNFWQANLIQEFWSGDAFHRIDEGSELAYELARIMVEWLAKDWDTFKKFVLNAHSNDAGEHAAATILDIDLGKFVCALLEKEYEPIWSPYAAQTHTTTVGDYRSQGGCR